MFSFVRFFHRREWLLAVAVFFMIVFEVWLDLEIPNYMAAITDVITSHGTPEEVMAESVGMVVCCIGSLIVGLGISIIVGWISSSVAKTIREAQFDHVQKFSLKEIDAINAYSLITRSTNDVKQIQDFIGNALESFIRAPIISIWAILRISFSDMSWTAVTMVSIMAMVLLVVAILRLVSPLFKKVQFLNDGINASTMQMLTGQRVIRAYNAEHIEREKFDRANDALYDNNVRAGHIMAYSVPFNGFIRNTLSMGIYWIGAFIIAATASEGLRLELFSEMIVFATYAIMALNGFRTLIQIFNVFPRAKVSMDRINEVLELEPTVVGGT